MKIVGVERGIQDISSGKTGENAMAVVTLDFGNKKRAVMENKKN